MKYRKPHMRSLTYRLTMSDTAAVSYNAES